MPVCIRPDSSGSASASTSTSISSASVPARCRLAAIWMASCKISPTLAMSCWIMLVRARAVVSWSAGGRSMKLSRILCSMSSGRKRVGSSPISMIPSHTSQLETASCIVRGGGWASGAGVSGARPSACRVFGMGLGFGFDLPDEEGVVACAVHWSCGVFWVQSMPRGRRSHA